jgi:hypothetical protein
MKKDKTIRIKDPKLRKIRNYLRIIIKKSVHDKQMEILDCIERFMHIMKYNNGKEPTTEEDEEAQKLSIERKKLENDLNRSIIYCQNCKSWDKDMRYFPNWAEWVCVDCYDDVVKRWKHAEKYHKESKERGW